MPLINMKLFRGDAEVITPAQVREQLLSIALQHSQGLKPSAGPVRSMKPQVNVRELVKAL